MNKQLLLQYLFALIIVFSSCKTKKTAVDKDTPVPKREALEGESAKRFLLETVKSRETKINYYSSEGSAAVKSPDQNVTLDVAIVMEQNRYIMLTFTAILGIEAARVLITNDSISILDRLSRKHYIANYSYIERLTGIKLNLSQIQDLLLGNMIFPPNEKNSKVDTITPFILISHFINPDWKQTVYLKEANIKPIQSIINNQKALKELKVSYEKYYTSTGNSYPSEMNINIRAEKNIECKLTLNTFAFTKNKEINFVVPKSYQNIRL
jgi:outer membrane biogenesis lipoprotein LolB